MTDSPLTVIVPANNEAGYITPCLEALLAQRSCPPLYVVVSANACTDSTVAEAQALAPQFAALGHTLICLDSLEGGKTAALDRAEAAVVAAGQGAAPRVYLDADVICDPDLLGQVARAHGQANRKCGRCWVDAFRGARRRCYNSRSAARKAREACPHSPASPDSSAIVPP